MADVEAPRVATVGGRAERGSRGSGRRVRAQVVGAVTLALTLALLWLGWLLSRPIALLVAAIILANALEPVADSLARRMPRTYAIAAIYVALFALIVVAGALVVPSISDQAAEVGRNLPSLIERGQGLVARWGPLAGGVSGSAGQSVLGGGWIASVPLAIVSSALEVVVVVFLSLYWLLALPTLRAFVLSLAPSDRADELRSVLREVGQTMGGYVRGVLIEALLIGTIVFIGMQVIGVEYPLVLAVLSAVGEFVPYVGPIVAAIPAVLLALLDSPSQALVVIAFYVVLQIVEGYVLFSLVVGSQSEIPPLLIIVGLLAGGAVGGVLGALVAIPLAGALRVVVLRLVAPAIRRRTGGAAPRVDAGDE